MKFLTLAVFSLPLLIRAQRPSKTSTCDFYSNTLLGSNTAKSQALLITLLVNTFVVGNYTTPNTGIPCAGFASPAVFEGHDIALLPYFTGAYNSTNEGGNIGAAGVLFLDDGGATPLQKNMSSNGDVGTRQYDLLTHIYGYFGNLLNCSQQGTSDFPSYGGRTSMYKIHQFMDFDTYQMTFFISTVKSSALSLGFAEADATVLYNTLDTLFNRRCSPPLAVSGINAPPELQSICIAANCPLDPNSNCSAYPDNGIALIPVNVTKEATGTASSSGVLASPTGTAKPNGTVSTGGAEFGMEIYSLPLLVAAIGSLAFAFSVL
ncbi:hypothetical protein N431DRAFT_447960 [Stipitochalara longipes BDJ]|nr:hypothetical protein N431DRAFT_447960 [Stipitochalara longipes BDJ]